MHLTRRTVFHAAHNYNVALPPAGFVAQVRAYLRGELSRVTLQRAFATSVAYDIVALRAAAVIPRREHTITTRALHRLARLRRRWRLNPRLSAIVLATPYGMGGSYNAAAAKVTLKVRPDGLWPRPLSHMILHELIHVSIESVFCGPYGLTHGEKEALVDTIVALRFEDLLNGYTPQRSRDGRIDPYVTLRTLPHLHESLARFIADYPRPVRIDESSSTN